MKTQVINRTYLALILATILIVFGTQEISYGQTITASTPQPLTEANLHGSVVTLTLNGKTYYRGGIHRRDMVTVSGIEGVTFERWDVDRVSDTEVTVELTFDGTDFDTDAILTFTVGAIGIAGYNGQALTAQVPVTALPESLSASTEFSLTEGNLHGSVVTLTLTGRAYDRFIKHSRGAVTVSGIDGVTFDDFFDVDRVSDTAVTVELTFDGDFDTDTILTFTVGAEAIVGYNEALTAQVPVTAIQESLVVSAASPLTEATLHENVVTLTLSGRNYTQSNSDVRNAVAVSGIDGVTFERRAVSIVSDTEVTVKLTFRGDFDTDATLTFTVGADAITGYGQALTAQVPVTAIQESLVVSTASPLTEATLHESIVTLTLNGGTYREYDFLADGASAVSVSGIEGVTLYSTRYRVVYSNGAVDFGRRVEVERISDTEARFKLTYDGTDFDTDAILTFTVGAEEITGYNGQALIAQIPVPAIENSNATVSISPSSMLVSTIGEQLMFSLNIANGENVAGYQATVSFDDSLRYMNSANGDYLPADAFFGAPIVKREWIGETYSEDSIWDSNVTLTATALVGVGNGEGTLATLTFRGVDFKASTLTLSQVSLIDSDGKLWEATTENGEVTIPPEPQDIVFGDINRDNVVNIQDLLIVHSLFGQGYNLADVNWDGLVDIADLVLVAGAFDEEAAAPSVQPQALELFNAADVQGWLSQAQQLALTDLTYLRGIAVLEQLRAALIPQETALLPNYPNPFNPETWIPYRLAEDAFVTLTIYDSNGQVVRTLDIGHRIAAFYESRSKAIYWDGTNEIGEQVASGVYFYHLSAGDFSATRRMPILK